MFFLTKRACPAALWVKTASVHRSFLRNKSKCKKTATFKPTELIDVSTALATPEELERKKKLDGKIIIMKAGKTDVSPLSGIPANILRDRRARIHKPPKNAMQSGTNNLRTWQIEFDNQQRWENPCMGWTSTGDPLSNLQLNFSSQEAAIEYCERNGWRWYVDAQEQTKKQRFKNYGINFHHKNRTRISTK